MHLHLHTEYSLLDGMCRIDEVTKLAHSWEMPALAITDHGNMFGAIQFYKIAIENGVKPIIGSEFYIAPGSRFDKKTSGISEASFHLTVLAKNKTGYQNLMLLSSLAYLEGFYYRPRMDKELLEKYKDGLVVLSGCMKGEIPVLLKKGDYQKAKEVSNYYKELFGDDFYLELMDAGIPEQKIINKGLIQLGKELSVSPVATNDCHYLKKEEAYSHEVLLCVQTNSKMSDEKRLRFTTHEFYFKTPDEMKKLFSEVPSAITNTREVAEKCNLKLELGKTHLPTFQPPSHFTQDEYLDKLCQEGLKEKFGDNPDKEVVSRLSRELDVIKEMAYPSYFLIISDFVRFAKEREIPVGPGRGSAAGCLVAYLLNITEVNPLKYGLLFERFLNPERVSLPDIDIDFCDRRRFEVVEYIRKKYGERNTAQIVTFGTMAARGVIRDVGRVTGMDYNEVDRIAKLVPPEIHITLQKALSKEPELNRLVETNEDIKKLFKISLSLEGLARHASTHAAGLVISEKPLYEYTPLFKGPSDEVATQYEMNSLSDVGLLKIDLLGLKTLTVISETKRLVADRYKKEIKEVPLDDKKTYHLLSRGDTFGVFQLESRGMRDLLTKIKPATFEDIIAILALYRPGPLGSGMVDDFIKNKKDPKRIRYETPSLEPILKPTHGVILYQEQVIEIVSSLGGFSLGRADLVRRAMSKKDPEVLESNRELFIKGAREKGISQRTAEKIFNQIIKFAGYGFNKSHSAGYALISYQTAYLKAHYPLEFMAALLTSEMGNPDKIAQYAEECERMKIWILPPDIEDSESDFSLFGNDIRFGLAGIKNVGKGAVESVIKERRKKKFNSFFDFSRRVDLRLVNRKVVESLIKAGAFDLFGSPRAQLFELIPLALRNGSGYQERKRNGQLSIFGSGKEKEQIPPDIREIKEWSESRFLSYEKQLLGFYLSGHPLGKYKEIIEKYSQMKISDLTNLPKGERVRLGGIVDKIKRTVTRRKGERMAIATLEDLSGKCEVVIFPEAFRDYGSILRVNSLLFVEGTLNLRNDQPTLVASELIPISEVPSRFTKKIEVELYLPGLEKKNLDFLKEIIKKYPGDCPLYLSLVLPEKKEKVLIETDSSFHTSPTEDFIQKVKKKFGAESLHLYP